MQIDEGIPVPPPSAHRNKGYTAIVRTLKPGQSVLLPTTYGGAYSILSYLYALKEFKRGAFAVRVEGEGARVWRLEESDAQ